MNALTHRLRIVVLTAFGILIATGSPAQIPAKMWSADSSSPFPIWVSEEEFLSQGATHWELLSIASEDRLRERLEHARHMLTKESKGDDPQKGDQQDCQLWSAPPPYRIPDLTLEEIAQSSMTIHSGIVTDAAQGVFQGKVGTLYQIDEKTGIEDLSREQRTYLFFPEGKIEVDGEFLCSTAMRDFKKPLAGKGVLWLEPASTRQITSVSGATISGPRPEYVVFELADGQLSYPRNLIEIDSSWTLPRLVDHLKAASLGGGDSK